MARCELERFGQNRANLVNLLVFNLLLLTLPAQAQLTPDNTLGTNASQITPNVLINGANADRIDGGVIRDINLFHSFREFNINENQRVYFANPSGVQNILTRVTGANPSNIFGTLGVDGAANLFLINPNGILFGQNASLDIRGSFVGTTANSVQFGNQGFFSATNPEAPPLLTVNPNALFFNQINANANITNRSQAPAGVNPEGNNTTGLRVPDGKSFLFVGGNINLDGGSIRAYDGRVELTGLATPGSVGLNIVGDSLSLSIPQDVALSDVFISNNAVISLFGSKGGAGAINARNIGMNSGGIYAGIAKNKGTPTTQAGDVNLNATDAIALTQNSAIFNYVDTGGVGNAGNIRINSGSFTVRDSASLVTAVLGQGNGADITLQVGDRIDLSDAFISSGIGVGGVGNGGDININGGSLSLTDNSQIQSRLEGTLDNSAGENLPGARGNAGDININIKGDIIFARPKLGNTNGIISSVGLGAVGNGGNVNINAENMEILGGSEIQGSTFGQGNAGEININTRGNLLLDGRNGNGVFSRIITSVQPNAVGNAGKINIATGNLKLSNGTFLSSSTVGQGNGGDITVETRENSTLETGGFISSNIFDSGKGNGGSIRLTTGNLLITGGSRLTTNVTGQGNAGNIIVNARDTIRLDDITGDQLTGIESGLLTSGIGKSGEIEITTGSLFAENGARLSANTDGQGNAGNIAINARDIVSFNTTAENKFNSSISNSVGSNAIGNGGDIRITAREVSFTNGSSINAASFGQGNAGKIFIDARDQVNFAGSGSSFNVNSGAFTFANKGGIAGNIQLKTGSLTLNNGGQISATTLGQGNAGNIDIAARNDINISGINSTNNRNSGIYSVFASNVASNSVGKGGNIQVQSENLFLSDFGIINASTSGKGNAGNINIHANDGIWMSDTSYIRATVESGGIGIAGDIDITSRTLSVTGGSQVQSALFRPTNNLPGAQGQGGNIRVTATDSVTLSGYNERGFSSGLLAITDRGTVGDAGVITVTTGNFTVQNGGLVNAGTGNGGKGGSITINANNFTATSGGQVSTSTNNQGDGGIIKLNVRDRVIISGRDPNFGDRVTKVITRLQQEGETDQINDVILNQEGVSGIFATTSTGSTGKGGSIIIDPTQIIIRDGAKISVNSAGTGDAGDIFIIGGSLILDNKATISAQTNSSQGGNIDLQLTDYLLLRGNSNISTTAGLQQSGGDGGNIRINTPAIVAIPNQNNDITANAFTGRGGNVNITTQALFGIAPATTGTDTGNEITASSSAGVQGQVSVSEPDIDPAQGIIELPAQLEDKSDQIGSACPHNYADSENIDSFTITGRGSLAPSALELLTGELANTQLATLETINNQDKKQTHTNQPESLTPIVEAQGWIKSPDGKITLVAQKPTSNPIPSNPSPNCP